MNWGIRITILYLSFVALILTLVFNCMSEKVELESPDYYAKELAYQEKIDAINNANASEETIDHVVNGKQIILRISPGMQSSDLKGQVYFYRPSNSLQDLKFPMQFNAAGEQTINGIELIHGLYKMQLSWTVKGKKYFKEEVINIK